MKFGRVSDERLWELALRMEDDMLLKPSTPTLCRALQTLRETLKNKTRMVLNKSFLLFPPPRQRAPPPAPLPPSPTLQRACPPTAPSPNAPPLPQRPCLALPPPPAARPSPPPARRLRISPLSRAAPLG